MRLNLFTLGSELEFMVKGEVEVWGEAEVEVWGEGEGEGGCELFAIRTSTVTFQ